MIPSFQNVTIESVMMNEKLDGIALLITDPPPTSSTTLSSTMQNQDSI